jgi:nucleotide-binding universal stress UspA family protein
MNASESLLSVGRRRSLDPVVFTASGETTMLETKEDRASRVVVGVHGSLTSLAALRSALEIARDRDAVLVPVLTWTPVGGEMAYRRAPCGQLLHVWRTKAQERLDTAFDEALGGYPSDVEVFRQVARATAGPALVELAEEPGDVLVVGAGRHRVLGRRLPGPTTRYCIAHAACPVLLVPPPELLQHSEGHLRHWGKSLAAGSPN